MDKYSVADGQRWASLRRELDSLIAQGLARPEIADELRALQIPAAEVARAVRDKPHLIVRYRMVADWPRRFLTAAESTARRRDREHGTARLPPLAGLAIGVLIVILYFTLTPISWRNLNWAEELVAALFSLCFILLAGWIARYDLLMLLQTVRSAQDSQTWRARFLTEVVAPELRQYIAKQRRPVYGSELSVDRARLGDDGETPTVVTSAGHQLRRILCRSTAEAVAIAGPRGVGKTTTIRAIADGLFSDPEEPLPLPVIASAPSRYEARDFVLHLHVVLCQQVAALTSALLLLPAQRSPATRSVLRLLAWSTTVVLLLAALSGIALAAWPGSVGELLSTARRQMTDSDVLSTFEPTPHPLEEVAVITTIVVLLGTTIMTLSALLATSVWLGGLSWRRSRRRRRADRYPGLVPLRVEALDQLRHTRFLQTYTSGWSGKIGMPFNAEAGWNASVQQAEQNLTYPEVIDNFRRFAELSATTLISNNVIERVVIAIDEVDKIADPAQAHELVNDVKGIFGIPHCLFLVSVSEDAMSAFERRGIPVRDAFDSAFTQMVRMDNFTLAESRRWLSRRLLGVPEQFTYLLHCLSGGLPRELRRMTIELVDIVSEDGRGDLTHVTGVLLDRELDRKTHAFLAAARRFDDTDELSEYLADLVTMLDTHTPAEQVALAARLAPDKTVSELRRMRWQSACFLLFCATVREVFDNTLDEAGLGAGLESLARARGLLAVDPQVAWRLVESTRATVSLGSRNL